MAHPGRRDRAELFVDYLGLSETQIVKAGDRLSTDGKYAMAADLIESAEPRFPDSDSLKRAKRFAYLKRMEKNQNTDPFKFIIYLAVAAAYLSLPHMAHPERGCPVAALGTELIRSGPKVRKVVSKEMLTRLEKLYQRTAPHATSENRRQQAAGVLACMVGGLILARTLSSADGAQFLADCQGFLRDALVGETGPD